MFSSPAIAGNTLYIGSDEGKLIAIDLTTQKPAWVFQTDGSRKNGAIYTKADGSPNYEAAFTDFFYDDMVSGVQKMMSVGAISVLTRGGGQHCLRWQHGWECVRADLDGA